MAKQQAETKIIPRGKMTFVMFQLEGSDDTLREGFKAMASAFEKLSPSPLLSSSKKTTPAIKVAGSTNEDSFQEEESGEEEIAEEASVVISGKKVSKPRPVPEPIDLDFDSDVSLTDFFAQHGNPESDNKRYMIAAAWLKNHRSMDYIDAAHIYTIFRYLKFKPQKDLTQPFRSMKPQGWFKAGEKAGTFVLTGVGFNEVKALQLAL